MNGVPVPLRTNIPSNLTAGFVWHCVGNDIIRYAVTSGSAHASLNVPY